MKKSILLFSFFFSSLLIISAQHLPNGDMEEWITLEDGKETPVGWISKDVASTSSHVYCKKTDDAFSGEAAFTLHNYSTSSFCSAGYVKLEAMIRY